MEIKRYGSYPQALSALAEKIRSRSFSFDDYYIILTPDRYTQSVENALFKNGGAIDCEVLTLSRLARRIAPNDKILSREGGVMITARAVAAVRSELTYYGRAVRYVDFARSVYDTLMQIKSSDTDIAALSASGATQNKLDDLARIRTEYDKLKAEFADPSDRLTSLIERASASELIARSRIYAIGYSLGKEKTTKLNMRVFETLAKYAKSFEYIEADEPRSPRRSMEIFEAPDGIAQYKEVATRIRDYIYRGGCYGDISVICPEPRALSRILREYDIPFYTDEAVPLAETPPLVALSYMYKLLSSDDGASTVALCKNPFSGCDGLDAERLQYYINERGRNYGLLEKGAEDEGAARALGRVKKLVDAMRACSAFASAVRAVAELGEFEKIQRSLFSDGGTERASGTDMLSPLLALTELSDRYGSGDFDADAAAFFSAARAIDVRSLPREKDRVTVTTAPTLRLSACKRLYVTDFNEGVLPCVTDDGGLLSDAELSEINDNGGRVEPSALEQNRRNRAELRAVVCNAEQVFCCYSVAGGARPASFMESLAVKNGIVKRFYYENLAVLAESSDAQTLAKYACVQSAARELAARGGIKNALSLKAVAGDGGMTAKPFVKDIGPLSKTKISVSELTHWFKCPYKRFLSDTVGLKERKTGELGAPDFGIIVHDFMRRFINETPLDCGRENVERIIDGILAEKDIRLDDDVRARIADDAVDYAELNKRIIEAGEYRPVHTELPFGGRLYLGKARSTEFVGVIDRVDACGARTRIIDYKTGNKKFSVGQCLNGCDMQLPLYAAALGRSVTGMFYLRLGPKYDGKDRAMSGCMVRDADIALEYDGGLIDGAASDIVPVRLKRDNNGETSVSGNCGQGLMPREQFDALVDACVENASVAADEISSGYIERTPVEDACEYCAYRGICGNGVATRYDRGSEDGQ